MLWVQIPPEPLYVPVEEPGVLGTPSRCRPRVQIPSGTLDGAVRKPAKRPSSNLGDGVGSTPTRATDNPASARALASPSACKAPAAMCRFDSCPAHCRPRSANGAGNPRSARLSARPPASQPGQRGSTPLRTIDMAKWRNRQTRSAQNAVPTRAWEFNSPLGHSARGRLEPGCQHGLISRSTPVQIRPPQLEGLRCCGRTPPW